MSQPKSFLLILFLSTCLTIAVNIITKGVSINFTDKFNKPRQANKIAAPFDKQIKIGGSYIFVEIANTDQKRRVGLSEKAYLGENEGMLFVFEDQNLRPSFWMKNMKFAIDIIWIDGGEVIQIHENVPPPEPDAPDSQLKFYTPNQSVDYVLEVAAGFTEKNNINVGDSVNLGEIFNN